VRKNSGVAELGRWGRWPIRPKSTGPWLPEWGTFQCWLLCRSLFILT